MTLTKGMDADFENSWMMTPVQIKMLMTTIIIQVTRSLRLKVGSKIYLVMKVIFK